MNIRNITRSDNHEILRLNEDSVNFLSPLNANKLESLIKQAIFRKVAIIDEKVAAFILAFDRDSNYDSPNYLWFKDKYDSFLYIDRIVVSSEQRRKGIADAIYEEIIEYASRHNYDYLTCEIDIVPPNPSSIRFHENHKFIEVGTQWLYNGEKQVSLRERRIMQAKE